MELGSLPSTLLLPWLLVTPLRSCCSSFYCSVSRVCRPCIVLYWGALQFVARRLGSIPLCTAPLHQCRRFSGFPVAERNWEGSLKLFAFTELCSLCAPLCSFDEKFSPLEPWIIEDDFFNEIPLGCNSLRTDYVFISLACHNLGSLIPLAFFIDASYYHYPCTTKIISSN